MGASLRIVQINLAYDAAVTDPEALLDRYHTLTGLSDALARAGASVRVVQRFGSDASLSHDGVAYRFVADEGPLFLAPSSISPTVIGELSGDANGVDVVHLNGLMFPGMVTAIRASVPRALIVLQDHAGVFPPGRFDRFREPGWHGLAQADAWSFTAADHATAWREAGLLGDARVLEIVEASTTMRVAPRDEARARTGISGDPAVLWVGRLNANKDPLTVLEALAHVFPQLPDARGWMIYGDATLEREVRRHVEQSPALRNRVTLLGRIAHEQMADYYSAADIFVSGSHREGSGYALIEAMACAAVPVVTDIPSFRVIAGECGLRWTPGRAEGCANAILAIARRDRATERASVRARFERALSWDAIGRDTLAAYQTLADAVRGRASRS